MGPSVWLIAGPTASGKSALALRLAEVLGGEVVNAASMQLYADLAVLTARPAATDLARAAHHLYGVADAAEAWSVGRWLEAARAVLEAIAARGRPAIVTGGTGLYFTALVRGLADIPAVPAELRDRLISRYEALGETAFRSLLAEGDPTSAARIQAGDRQRLIRASSVLEATGRSLASWQAAAPPTLQPSAMRAAVLDPPRHDLYARCDRRLEAMTTGGALEEVGRLSKRRLSPALPAMKALGVREFIDVLENRRSLRDALAAAQLQTRRYAKRQSTWFRNQTPNWPRIEASAPDDQWSALQVLMDETRA